MPNYADSKIYKMYSLNNPSKVYIGSTCQQLARRKTNHVNNHRLYKEGRYGYTTSFEIIELGNVRIELVEKYPCTDKSELHQREGHWIRNLDCVNKVVPGRDRTEWYSENNDVIRLKRKRRYEEKKDEILTKQKEYNKANKDIINKRKKSYYKANLADITLKQKEYREANKDKIKEENRKYREANKDKIKERSRLNRKPKITCECGSTVCKGEKSKHEKTKKHQAYIASKE